MVRYDILPLMDREVFSSDDAIIQEDLPTRGGLSDIDVIVRAKNGATSNLKGFPTELIEHLEIIVNGDQRRFSLNGEEAFRYAWMRDGKPPGYVFSEQGGVTQELHIPIQFGRFREDPLYGMKLSQYENVQIQLDYDLVAPNAVGSTGYAAAANVDVSMLLHITPANKEPAYRGMIGAREIQSYTTVASGDEGFKLPTANSLVGIGVYNKKTAIAGATTVTHARISLDTDSYQPYRGRWDFHVAMNRERLYERSLMYGWLAANDEVKVSHLDNIVSMQEQVLGTTWENGEVVGIDQVVSADAVVGDSLTLCGNKYASASTAGATTGAALDAAKAQVLLGGDIGHFIYWPMGNRMTLDELLDPKQYADPKVILTNGEAGATVGIIVEELRSS